MTQTHSNNCGEATSPHLSRRVLFAGAASAAALLSLQDSIAQTAAAGGDWFAMVKSQHEMVAKTFDEMLASGSKTFLRRAGLQRRLAYLLTAHSVAEENVLYPALAANGLVTESDKLYLDQAHAKVMNANLEMSDVKDESAWLQKVRTLQAAVLKHAKEDEEAQLYPQLQQKLDAATNAKLTAAFRREFTSVKPTRDVLSGMQQAGSMTPTS